MNVRPTEAVLGVIWRCNSRCQTCDVWKVEGGEELKAEDYRLLPPSLRRIGLGGFGEPTLREDLPEIIAAIHLAAPRARIVVTTNGLLPDRTAGLARQMPPGTAFAVSLDGLGPLYDEVRGTKGGFEKVDRTLGLLREAGIRDLGVGMTISRFNVHQVNAIAQWARDRGLSFSCTVAQASDVIFGPKTDLAPDPDKLDAQLAELQRVQLQSSRPKEWAKAYFTAGLRAFARREPRWLPCRGGRRFFYLDPGGDIFPCNVLGLKLGHLKDGYFTTRPSPQVRAHYETVDRCEQCWMQCNVAPMMRARPTRPLLWILRHKLAPA